MRVDESDMCQSAYDTRSSYVGHSLELDNARLGYEGHFVVFKA